MSNSFSFFYPQHRFIALYLAHFGMHLYFCALSHSQDVGAGKPVNRLAPESLLPAIIHVSRFDGDYNNRPPLRFRVPKGTLGVRLVVVISGE